MPKLSVVIPAYNRSSELEKRMAELVPQLTDDVELVIRNDASTDDTLKVCEKYEKIGVRVHNHQVNAGLCANMFLSFFEADSDWIWNLGDDDSVKPDAIQQALGLISKYNNVAIINFTSHACKNSHEMELTSITDFLSYHEITNLLYMSANLYNLKKINKHLNVMVQSSVTYAPHVALIVRTLQSGTGSLQLSVQELLQVQHQPIRWSSMEVAVGLSLFPEFVENASAQKQVALSIWRSTRWMLIFGIREIYDHNSFTRWKQMSRRCNAILATYRKTPLNLFYSHHLRFDHIRSAIIIFLFGLLPFSFIETIARKMRNKQGGANIIRQVTTTDS